MLWRVGGCGDVQAVDGEGARYEGARESEAGDRVFKVAVESDGVSCLGVEKDVLRLE